MSTLTALCRALAWALDDLQLATLSGGSTTTAVSASFVNATTGATSGLYEGRWVYNLTTLVQSKVSAYVPSTGTLTLTPAGTTGANGHVVELTHLFPRVAPASAPETDYLTITNRALARMVDVVLVPFLITTSDIYTTQNYPSLARPEQLREVREPSPIPGRQPTRSDRGWHLVQGTPAGLKNERPFLTASGSIEVDWLRSLSTWCARTGVYRETTNGLELDGDEAIPSVDDWLPFALEEALTVLIGRSPGRPNAEWARLLQQAQADIARSPYLDRSQQQTAAPAAAGAGWARMTSPIIDPIGGVSGALGILRPLYRRALMAQFGPFITFSTTAVSTHGEARRHVVATSLLDDDAARERLKGRYLYVATGASAGHQARITDTGYHGGGGVLEVSRPFDAALPIGTVVEISAGLPCEQYIDTKGGNQFVNEALARCLIESRLTLTGNGTRSYSLLAYEQYLDQQDRVDAVYDGWAIPTGDPNELAASAVRVDETDGERTLITGYAYAADQTFEVRVLRAGHTLVNDGNGWVTSVVGLSSDSDAAAVPIPWVVAFGMVKALDAHQQVVQYDTTLDDKARGRQLADIVSRRQRWARTARLIALTQFPRPTPPFRDAMVNVQIVSPGALVGLP